MFGQDINLYDHQCISDLNAPVINANSIDSVIKVTKCCHSQQEVSHLHGVKLNQFPDQLGNVHSSFDISLLSDSMAGTSDSSIIAVCSVSAFFGVLFLCSIISYCRR